MKQALKIELLDHSDFLKAWDALIALGYRHPEDSKPDAASFLYADADGLVVADCHDGADLSDHDSAFSYFYAHKNKQITLGALLKMAYGAETALFHGVESEYLFYSVDADNQAYYTKVEPHISQNGDYWGKDISMKDAPNFELHTDWKQSLIKRKDSEATSQ